VFVSLPRLTASSCRTTQVKAGFSQLCIEKGASGEDGKKGYVDTKFSFQMEVFLPENTEMPAQQTIGVVSFLLFVHTSQFFNIRRDEWNKIHPDRY